MSGYYREWIHCEVANGVRQALRRPWIRAHFTLLWEPLRQASRFLHPLKPNPGKNQHTLFKEGEKEGKEDTRGKRERKRERKDREREGKRERERNKIMSHNQKQISQQPHQASSQ